MEEDGETEKKKREEVSVTERGGSEIEIDRKRERMCVSTRERD